MKKNIGLIILIFIMCIITAFLAYVVISKQHMKKESFNIKEGQVIKYDKYDIEVKVLNIASVECNDKKKCKNPIDVEVSLMVTSNKENSNYTLKTNDKYYSQIKNSNYYIILNYEDDKINIEIKDKKEM